MKYLCLNLIQKNIMLNFDVKSTILSKTYFITPNLVKQWFQWERNPPLVTIISIQMLKFSCKAPRSDIFVYPKFKFPIRLENRDCVWGKIKSLILILQPFLSIKLIYTPNFISKQAKNNFNDVKTSSEILQILHCKNSINQNYLYL